MKEISKKELMSQIAEEKSNLTESRLYIPGREDKQAWEETPEERMARGLSPEFFQKKTSKRTSWWLKGKPDKNDPNPPNPDGEIVRDPAVEGGFIVIMQIEGVAVRLITEDILKEEDPKFYEWATTPPMRLAFINVNQKIKEDLLGLGKQTSSLRPSHLKYRGQVSDVPFPEPGADDTVRVTTDRKKILDILNKKIREFSDNVSKHLVDSGLPPIAAPQRFYGKQTKNINKYTVIKNEDITWATQNSFLYPTIEAFMENAASLYSEETPQYQPKDRHLVRQFNPGRNWTPTRPTEEKEDSYKNDPLTPVLGLKKGGYDADPFDIQIADYFDIKGNLTQAGEENASAYKWTMKFKTQYAKKLREDKKIQGGLKEDKNFESTSTTGPLSQLAGENGTIVTNEEIMAAFDEALSDLQSQILSIDPEDELLSRFAGVGRTEGYREVNESIDVDTIVSKIINKLKQ
jgi:hypothetical protein